MTRDKALAPGYRLGTGPSPRGFTVEQRVRDIRFGRGLLPSRDEARALARAWLTSRDEAGSEEPQEDEDPRDALLIEAARLLEIEGEGADDTDVDDLIARMRKAANRG